MYMWDRGLSDRFATRRRGVFASWLGRRGRLRSCFVSTSIRWRWYDGPFSVVA